MEQLEKFILDKMSKTHLPGLSLAVVNGDDIVYSRGFGFRDVENALPATPDTLYGIGSITKSLTAFLIMQLIEQDKLRLTDPISRFLPLNLKSKGEDVCIEHLLSHTSGIPALGYAEAFIGNAIGSTETSLSIKQPQDVPAFMEGANDWALFPPGKEFFYLNEGYVLLGLIIENVSGMSYENYLKHHLLDPVGMKRSYFNKSEVKKDGLAAVPYIVTDEGKPVRSEYPYGIYADGGLISNVLDMAKFLSMCLNRGKCNSVTLLSRRSIEEMAVPRARFDTQDIGNESYGFGLIITPDLFGHKVVWHSGSTTVSTAFMGCIPDKGIGLVIQCNGAGYKLSRLGMYGLALMLDEDPRKLPFVGMENAFEMLAGTYETYKGTMKAHIVSKLGLLFIEFRDKYTTESIPLIPHDLQSSDKSFQVVQPAGRMQVLFHPDGDNIDLRYERFRLRKVTSV